MTELEFQVPRGCDLSHASSLIEGVFQAHGLRIVMTDTLRSYPECVHWHVKRGAEPGTLELTLWEAERRIWASVQEGRRAAWIEETLPRVKREVETALRHAVS